jgi:ABC-type enterochelin transport system ATPase subunit
MDYLKQKLGLDLFGMVLEYCEDPVKIKQKKLMDRVVKLLGNNGVNKSILFSIIMRREKMNPYVLSICGKLNIHHLAEVNSRPTTDRKNRIMHKKRAVIIRKHWLTHPYDNYVYVCDYIE